MEACHEPAQRPVYGRPGTTTEFPKDPKLQHMEDSQLVGKVAEVAHVQ